jgi:hypothetical protein
LGGEQDHHSGWTGHELKRFLGRNPPCLGEGRRPEKLIVAHLPKLGFGGEQSATGLLGVACGDDAFDGQVALGNDAK